MESGFSYFVQLQDEYASTKILRAFRECRICTWKEAQSPRNATICWQEYEQIDWELHHKQQRERSDNSAETPPAIINAYCIRKGLIRKSQNALLIEMYAKKRPNSLLTVAFPLTVLFNLDCLEYLDEALNECFEVRDGLSRNQRILDGDEEGNLQVFMMKPSLANRANGLFVFRTMQEFEAHLEDAFAQEDDEELGCDDEDVCHY